MPATRPASVLPYVSWADATFAEIPADAWERVYGSLQALKAHVQEYPGCQKLEAFVTPADGGAIRIHCYTVWDTPEQLDAFVERGYTLQRMLADVADVEPTELLLMEKVF